ncbi:MAG: flagellar biosynthesis protein FliQ [Deltaproteobacteria bacterium]|nr:flagellar biosynthesis protein FliQ [Deltaproteobacteria bacterium]OGP25342.1 MAG: EscS/YscS/HrcS family type III secretion system export apparatus protein [Deltaproteobacteria bacterium GWB2_55_19]OGP37996.1 MAG: EscS/YscS/HrcS family type III secretion system export apparatus protein [Deltaproteobacteria bacterium GWC2_56_8]HAO93667.1 flagellar biosynthetic protein FliQ [Deltaproteobacteria bacterium]
MTPEFVTSIGKETIEVILMVSAPVLIAGMAVGLAVSIFQAVTQIQEMTLTFVPKIIVVFVVLLALSPWMMEIMINFTQKIFTEIPLYARG